MDAPPKEENSKAVVDSQETPQGIVRDSSGFYFARNPLLADPERAAISQGLEFTEKLTVTGGAEYSGKCDSFLPYFISMIKISGYILNGERHGPGVNIFADTATYEGEWREGKASGKGKLFHATGDVYSGDWKDDKANGFGKYVHANGAEYIGDWVNDL